MVYNLCSILEDKTGQYIIVINQHVSVLIFHFNVIIYLAHPQANTTIPIYLLCALRDVNVLKYYKTKYNRSSRDTLQL